MMAEKERTSGQGVGRGVVQGMMEYTVDQSIDEILAQDLGQGAGPPKQDASKTEHGATVRPGIREGNRTGVRPGVRVGTKNGSRTITRNDIAHARKKRTNYRLMLCVAVLVFFVLTVLFFGLFLSQLFKAKGLDEDVKKLTDEKQSLTQQVDVLTQENQTLSAGLISALPEPTTAQTNTLPDLIPQLTEGVYVLKSTSTGYQYLQIPSGYLQDKITRFSSSEGYAVSPDGGSPSCTYWVLFPDRVIGLAEGDVGYVSTERAATGGTVTVPAGFYTFVASLFGNNA